MPIQCPACQRPIHNRRRPTCEFCEAEIPPELLLSQEEREAISEEHRLKSAAQRKEDREKRDEERRNSRGSSGTMGGAFIP